MNDASSTWLFDLGNSRLKFARLRDDGSVAEVTALPHDAVFGGASENPLPTGACAHVASVVPGDRTDRLRRQLASRFDRVCMARTQDQWGRVKIAYPVPGQLGVDRFLTLLAADARGGPGLVVGVGTALTIDLVDADGLHRGGRIAPSPELMRAALHQRIPQLPETGGDYVEFADATPGALASGCSGAVLALVEGSQVQARALLGEPPRILLHGGGAGFLRERLPGAEWAPALVLEGLARWASQCE